jgi:hypothetical protein
VVSVVFLDAEEELPVVVVSLWQSHESCCCLHLPYLTGWQVDRDGRMARHEVAGRWLERLRLLLFLLWRWLRRKEDCVDRASFPLFSLLDTR